MFQDNPKKYGPIRGWSLDSKLQTEMILYYSKSARIGMENNRVCLKECLIIINS
jgi:hypothetical protein